VTNNDVLRRIRYTFNFSDSKMISLFDLAGETVTREQVSCWLKRDDHDDYKGLKDYLLATFLNGLINDKRGVKEGEPAPIEKELTNNIILRKLRIALNYVDADMLDAMALADFRISKPELTAFFRRPGHKHYRICKDQILRNFLQGIQIKYHVAKPTDTEQLSDFETPSEEL
jgi:uncharacterized protein YehS (DUF1456 family)